MKRESTELLVWSGGAVTVPVPLKVCDFTDLLAWCGGAAGLGSPVKRPKFTGRGVAVVATVISNSSAPAESSDYALCQVPVLEVDGKVVQQSKSIFRFLGREFGYDGATSWDQLQIDSIIETLSDLENEGRKVSHEKNAEKKEKLLKHYLDVVLRRIFGFLESILVKNNGGEGFLVGSKMTIADIMFFTHVHDYLGFIPEAKLVEPKLLGLYDRIKSNPQIAEWIKHRPVTKS